MKKLPALALVAILFAGCATANKMNLLGLGMTEREVRDIMGTPISVSVTRGVKILNYSLKEPAAGPQPYFVRLTNGRVDSFGKRGDFQEVKIVDPEALP
jgi:hypothetical protein